MNEQEMRKHRCCFTGHRPEKLHVAESAVMAWLEAQIDNAIAEGFKTFVTSCAMGVDIWAGQIIIKKRAVNPDIHLIAANPYPGFGYRWKPEWSDQYHRVLKAADLVRNISSRYSDDCFMKRNVWMVNHCSLVIAVYNGVPGGTKNTIEYAKQQGIRVIQMIPGEDNPTASTDRIH